MRRLTKYSMRGRIRKVFACGCVLAMCAKRAKLDPRVGGKYQIDMVGATATFEHRGEYLVVDRPRKLSFTWISIPTNNQRTVVTIELEPIGKDETELTLTHVGFPSAESAKNHEMGWGMILDKLATKVASQ